MTRNDLYGLLSDVPVLAAADVDAKAVAAADDLGLGSVGALLDVSLRSSRSVAELAVVLLVLAVLVPVLFPLLTFALLANGDVLVADSAVAAPKEPARGREDPAESGCAREF